MIRAVIRHELVEIIPRNVLQYADASIEDVDYKTLRRPDKTLFQHLAQGKWIARKQNLILTSPCGVGKSWLTCALGQKGLSR